jgi:hypothetical protein
MKVITNILTNHLTIPSTIELLSVQNLPRTLLTPLEGSTCLSQVNTLTTTAQAYTNSSKPRIRGTGSNSNHSSQCTTQAIIMEMFILLTTNTLHNMLHSFTTTTQALTQRLTWPVLHTGPTLK